MISVITCDLPESLITGLHRAAAPSPGADQRETALAWLRCALVDFTALNRHITLLQQIYSSPFCYPRPRRDGGGGAQSALATETRFRFNDPLPDDRVVAVVEGGVEVLGNEELGPLLLNPFALFDLFDVIGELGPDGWLPVMQEVGREMMRREGVTSPRLQAEPYPPLDRLAASTGPTRVGRKPRAALWGAVVGALAASLLLVGSWLLFGKYGSGNGGGPGKDLYASVTPKFDGERGQPGKLTALEIKSNFQGHVTVVFLAPEKKQQVVPDSGDDEVRVKGDNSPRLIDVPEGADKATVALVVVTETPADYSVRMLLDKKKFTADQIDDLEKLLRSELAERGFHRMTFTRVKLAR